MKPHAQSKKAPGPHLLAFDHFERLLQSPFYHKKGGFWIQVVDEKGSAINTSRALEAQLLYVMLLKIFGKTEQAKAVLQEFENRDLHDYILSKEQIEFQTRNVIANLELLYLLAKSFCQDEVDTKRLTRLEALPLFHSGKKMWHYSMRSDDKNIDPEFHSHTQLLYCWLIARKDKQQAKNYLKKIKTKKFYIPQKDLWMRSKNYRGTILVSDISSSTQLLYIALLGVLGEYAMAEKNLKLLRNTELYDKNKDEWLGAIDDAGHVLGTNRYAHSQLSAVLAEYFSSNKH